MRNLLLTRQEELFLKRVAIKMASLPDGDASINIAAQMVLDDDKRISAQVLADKEMVGMLAKDVYFSLRA